MSAPWQFRPGDEPMPGCRLVAPLGDDDVWRAESGPDGQPVAVRFLDLGPEANRLAAVDQLAAVRHPHLLPVIEVRSLTRSGRATAAVVSPLADDDLETRLGRHPDGLPAADLLPAFAAVAAALDHLHFAAPGAPRTHGRLKPSKLLFAADAVWLAGLTPPEPVDSLGVARPFGNPVYAAPEQLRSCQGPASDRYALAIVYHTARTGRPPFPPHLGGLDVIMRHLTGNLDFSAPGLLIGERAVLRWATATDPADRYPSCGDFVAELERVAAGRSPRSPAELARPR